MILAGLPAECCDSQTPGFVLAEVPRCWTIPVPSMAGIPENHLASHLDAGPLGAEERCYGDSNRKCGRRDTVS